MSSGTLSKTAQATFSLRRTPPLFVGCPEHRICFFFFEFHLLFFDVSALFGRICVLAHALLSLGMIVTPTGHEWIREGDAYTRFVCFVENYFFCRFHFSSYWSQYSVGLLVSVRCCEFAIEAASTCVVEQYSYRCCLLDCGACFRKIPAKYARRYS